MEKPKYGENNQSLNRLEVNFMKTGSDNKSLGFDEDAFNWEEDDKQQSPQKINLGQYEEEDNYDDDFEEEIVRSNDSTPKKSQRKSTKGLEEGQDTPPAAHNNQFTEEEEQIIDQYEFTDEKDKIDNKQKQVKEINDLIEFATNLCLK